jgi:hypothetical protein
MLVSVVLTTALLGFFYRSLKQSWSSGPSPAVTIDTGDRS